MACLQTPLTIKGKILEDGWQDFWEFFRFSEKKCSRYSSEMGLEQAVPAIQSLREGGTGRGRAENRRISMKGHYLAHLYKYLSDKNIDL